MDGSTTNVAKGIAYLKDMLGYLPVQLEQMGWETDRAIDQRIAENLERKAKGEPLDLGLELPEVNDCLAYVDSIVADLRMAVQIGRKVNLPTPGCLRLIQALELRFLSHAPDYKPFLFDSLVELEELMQLAEADPGSVAMFRIEGEGKRELDSIDRNLCEKVLANYYDADPERESLAAKAIEPELNQLLSSEGKKTSESTIKKCDRYKEACRKTNRCRQKTEITKQSSKRVSLVGAVQDNLSSRECDPLQRLIAEQERETASEEGRKGRFGRKIKSRD